MGKFQPKNQFWKARSSHGRDLIFSSPELMWEAAKEYFQWCDENPFKKAEWKTEDKALVKKKLPIPRPYSIKGLCIFWEVGHSYLRNFKLTNTSDDFKAVIELIEQTIETQQLEGATANFFNANIVSRVLGLADKKEIKANVNLSDTPIEFE